MRRFVQAPEFQVVIAQATWEPALRAMMRDPSQIATGLVRRDPHRVPTAMVADQLTSRSADDSGRPAAPLADWVALAMPDGEPPSSPERWLDRLRPNFGQLLAILLVGLGPDRDQWRGWSLEAGVLRPLAGFQIVGPDGLRVTTEPELPSSASDGNSQNNSDGNSDDNSGRWSRTVEAVGHDAFARLRQASVALIGTSRTGSLAAGMLAALGIRQLGLIDGDRVETHNLDGILQATEQDVGEYKALVVARRLAQQRPDLALRVATRGFGSRHEEPAVGDVDLVITCVDQSAPRLRAARDIARKRLIPHLDIGTGVTRAPDGSRELAADIRLLLPRAGCVRCVGGVGDLEEAEFQLRSPPGALPLRPPEPWDAQGRLGSLITLNAMAVATGIQSWLDLLAGRLPASVWHRIRWTSEGAGRWEVHAAEVAARDDCPICRGP